MAGCTWDIAANQRLVPNFAVSTWQRVLFAEFEAQMSSEARPFPCVFGVAAVASWGLLGAILGILGGYVTTAAVMLFWVLRTNVWAEPRMAAAPPG